MRGSVFFTHPVEPTGTGKGGGDEIELGNSHSWGWMAGWLDEAKIMQLSLNFAKP